jgi:hypothetical protein
MTDYTEPQPAVPHDGPAGDGREGVPEVAQP